MGAQITANNLHDLISDYNEVVFVAHSMGGIVTENTFRNMVLIIFLNK